MVHIRKTSADIAPMTDARAAGNCGLWSSVPSGTSTSNTHEAPAFSWRRVAARFSANRASTSTAGISLPALAESSPA